ncbi:MAG: VCBS repeat-containing protein [Bacteroidales bacterium]|nr:VCBS repeat-containing protein [Bacteroidales bacterium]
MNKFYLLFLIAICSSFSNSINAQGTAQYWQLYQTIQGGTYIARDWIELQPGFSFTASGNTFEAIIDESLPFNVMYSTTQPDPSQEHNKTLPVGSIPGSFAVSPTGAATYSIPIEISPGTNGVQPSLAITYNSQTGNGMMGVGWSISGLSSITRIPATFYNDNMYDGVDLDEKDRFALDGNRLILISTNKEYGENGAEYRTETETFSVIKSYDTNGDNSPEYFKAWTKSGIEIEFGSPNGGNSRFMVGTKALFWSINKMKDSHGNFITYQYNNANSEFYIDEIEYTGNDDISPAISPYNKIKFLYENRTIDQNTAYIQGYYIKQNMLLRKIDTYNENNLFRSYRFKYFNDVTNLDVVSHLVEISEEGHNGEKLNSSIFNWGNSLLKYQWLTSSINMTSSSKKYVGDFNGDGLNDLFFAVYEEDEDMYFEHWYLYLSQSGIGFQLEDDGTMNSNYHEVIVADCDHDGDDDIVFRKSKLINGNAREVLEGNILSDGELVFYEDISEISDITEEDGVRTFANDFDGNGTIDYLLIDKNNNFKEAIGFTVYSLQRGWNNFPKDIKIVDFDGDGRLDVLAIYNSETIIYSYIVEELNFVAIYNLSFPTANYRICEGDFNGDGKTDLLTYLNGWQLYYSNGNSYIQSTGTIPLVRSIDPGESYSYFRPDIIYGYDANYNYLINDFNGDGKSDILEYFNETGNHYVYMHYSTGIGFKTEYFVENNIDFIGHGDLMLDANGDGKTELFLNRCSDGENEKIIRFHSGETSNLVNKITDGYNQSITINYKSLADPYTNFYTKETGAIFPLNDIMVPLYTVSSYLSPNGVGSTNTVTLSYKGAKIHRQGKGFLGFTEIAAIDLITYIKTTQHYNPVHSIGSNTYYISLHEYSKVELLPNELLSETTNVYDFHEYGNKRIFPYLNETTTDDYLYDTRTVASSTINTDGNQTVSWVNYYEGTGLSATWIASTQTDYSIILPKI